MIWHSPAFSWRIVVGTCATIQWDQAWRGNGPFLFVGKRNINGVLCCIVFERNWEKLLVVLGEEDLVFDGGRAIDRDLVKKRIGMFCDAFDDMYKNNPDGYFQIKA